MNSKFLRFTFATLSTASLAVVCVFFFIAVRLDNDGLAVFFEHMWSDFPLHLAIAKSFELNAISDWFRFHPLFAALPLTYPFVMDMISGLLMGLHIGLEASFYLPAILFLGLFYFFLQKIGKEICLDSLAGAFAFLLFMLGAGFEGLWNFFSRPLDTAFASSLTRIDSFSWYSGNIINGFLLPQRTIVLGLCVMSIHIYFLIRFLSQKGSLSSNFQIPNRLLLVLLGLSLGLMPIIHAHAGLATAVFFAVVFVATPRRLELLFYAIPAALMGAFVVSRFTSHSLGKGFHFVWHPGWAARDSLELWPLMWLRIFGLAVPFLILSSRWWWTRNLATRVIGIWAMLLFVIGNLFLFQPVVWDNSKIFFFSYLGICLLLSVWFFENFPRTPFRSFVFTLSFLVAFCGSGFLELIYTVTTIRPNQVTSTNEQEIGAKIAEITPPLSRFLTAPSHNHFVMAWSGRPIVAGFTPWLDNFGVDGAQVLTDINQMLKEPSKSQTLFEKYKPDYIVLSSAERGMNVDEDFYTTCCTTIFKSVPGIEIVDIKKLRQNVLQGK